MQTQQLNKCKKCKCAEDDRHYLPSLCKSWVPPKHRPSASRNPTPESDWAQTDHCTMWNGKTKKIREKLNLLPCKNPIILHMCCPPDVIRTRGGEVGVRDRKKTWRKGTYSFDCFAGVNLKRVTQRLGDVVSLLIKFLIGDCAAEMWNRENQM